MPGFDGTGPSGNGPMTGGGRGPCSPYGPEAQTYGPSQTPASGARRPFFGRIRPRLGLGRGPFGAGFRGGRGRRLGRGRG